MFYYVTLYFEDITLLVKLLFKLQYFKSLALYHLGHFLVCIVVSQNVIFQVEVIEKEFVNISKMRGNHGCQQLAVSS